MQRAIIALLIILCSIAVVSAAPFIGHVPMTFSIVDYSSADNPIAAIFWGIRLPRVILGFVCGAALGLGGMVFQALFRNPLTTPYTLGVSSGAAFGATIVLKFGLIGSILGIPYISLGGLAGALGATFLVYAFSTAETAIAGYVMLLAGVAVSFFFSSLILFMQYLSDFSESFAIVRWLMGSVEAVGFQTVFQVLPFLIVGFLAILIYGRELDLLQCGEDFAASKGVEVRQIKLALFFLVSMMIGGVVAVTGPIGFVGMMVPHVCRLLLGPGHRLLALAVFFFAGAFLVACDTVARTVIAPIEMPVGVITALLGGPFFLFVLGRAVAPPEPEAEGEVQA